MRSFWERKGFGKSFHQGAIILPKQEPQHPELEPVIESQGKLCKSSIPDNEPAIIQKARGLLSLGYKKTYVMVELGLSDRDWNNWLAKHWGP